MSERSAFAWSIGFAALGFNGEALGVQNQMEGLKEGGRFSRSGDPVVGTNSRHSTRRADLWSSKRMKLDESFQGSEFPQLELLNVGFNGDESGPK